MNLDSWELPKYTPPCHQGKVDVAVVTIVSRRGGRSQSLGGRTAPAGLLQYKFSHDEFEKMFLNAKAFCF